MILISNNNNSSIIGLLAIRTFGSVEFTSATQSISFKSETQPLDVQLSEFINSEAYLLSQQSDSTLMQILDLNNSNARVKLSIQMQGDDCGYSRCIQMFHPRSACVLGMNTVQLVDFRVTIIQMFHVITHYLEWKTRTTRDL